MSVCDNVIKAGIQHNCAEMLSKGYERKGIIINRADIDLSAVTMSVTNDNIIEALPLKTGKKAYEVIQLGNNPFNGTKTSIEVGANVNTVGHEVALVVLDKGPDVVDNVIEGLLNGEFVVILENKHKGLKNTAAGSSAFQVFGFHQGLKVASGESDANSDDTLGGWAVVLKEEKAPKAAMFLYKTSYAATQTLISTLVAGV